MSRILVINPGSTSTKLALWDSEVGIFDQTNIQHSNDNLSQFPTIIDQLTFRRQAVEDYLQKKQYQITDFQCLAARGGLLKPLTGGTYRVNSAMISDLQKGVQGEHASNLAALIASELTKNNELPCFITDPVSVDEFNDLARFSGIKEINRRSLGHALNIKQAARRLSRKYNKDFKDCNAIIAHLGGGISIACLEKGKIVDVNNANEMGPYSPERSGGLPVGALVDMAFSEQYTFQDLKKMLNRQGGLYSYLQTSDCQEIERRIKADDQQAKLAYQGMIYQINKEIGANACVLKGQVDFIGITGGIANSDYVVSRIKQGVSFIATVEVVAEAMEMEALALGAFRVMQGQEQENIYQ